MNQEELQVTEDWTPEFLILEGVSSHQIWLVKEEAGLAQEEHLTSSMKKKMFIISLIPCPLIQEVLVPDP